MSAHTTWLLAIGAGLALVLLLAFTDGPKPVGATHEETEHCPADPTANQFIDISDVLLFTNAFGQTGPAHLDIAPELVGNGYVDISDVSMVTAHFGEACVGNTQLFADPPQTEGFGPNVSGCRSVTQGWPSGYFSGQVQVNTWGGIAFCYTDPDFTYRFECAFGWFRLVNGAWHLIANTPTEATVGQHDNGGQYCAANGFTAWLPCNVVLLGHAQLVVKLAASGTILFESFAPEDNFGFSVPC